MINLKRNLLTMALASTGFCWVAASSAAETTPAADTAVTTDAAANTDAATAKAKPKAAAEMEQIVVTGFRGSIESAIATKRDSSSIVESVSAEDIGKLPDVSIAEALARLPGLTAQRIDGRAQVISIRGLGPDLSTALLNGREQVTTGDNRGVEFDQYPAELLGSVVVYKTPDSTLIGQGLAGTVDLRTIRPLERGERILAVNARYEANGTNALNPDAPDTGYRASATYVDQFADDTVGITLGIAGQSTPTQSKRFNAWGFPNFGDGGPLVIGGAKPFAQSNDLDRVGLIGTLEFAPNDSFHSIVDLAYSDFSETIRKRGVELPLQWSGAQLQPGFTVDNGFITQGVFNNVKGVMRNDIDERNAKLFAFGWNVRNQFNESWAVESDLSYSRAKRDDFLLESYGGTGFNGSGATDSLGFQLRPGGGFEFSPTLDYTNPNLFLLTDPQGWGGGAGVVQAGFLNAPQTEDQLAHLKLSVERAFVDGAISKVIVGADFGRRDKDRQIVQEFMTLPGGAQSLAIPSAALLNGNVNLNFIGLPGIVVWDPRYLYDNVYVPVPVRLSSIDVPQDWKVREDVAIGFVRVDLDSAMGSVPVTGNIGFQVVHTDQSSGGFRVSGVGGGSSGDTNVNFIQVRDGDKYTRFLPSLNLIFDLGEDFKARFGAGRTLARSRMDQLNAGIKLNADITRLTSTDPNQAFFSANGGNPRLKPTLSTNIDLSLEKYFADGSGYVSLAGFYKDLKDFINPNDGFLHDFAEFVPDFLTPAQQAQLGTTEGIVSGPTNNGDGSIKGLEATVSVPLDLLAAPLEGFGVILSGSLTDSKVNLGSDPNPITVPGLSKWVANATVYFEKNGFQTRLSHRYRSDFLGEVSGLSATRTLRTVKSENILDAQISYAFQSGSLEGLTLLGQVNNLTNQDFVTFENGDLRRVIDRQEYGTTFLIGASYKF